jgi:hypothetical protein
MGQSGPTADIPARAAASRHPSDIASGDLQRALVTAERPDLLMRLVEISRRAFGFYTHHYPHTINYPWLAARLERLPTGSRTLDIGAGVNPLPLFLAERGIFVDCIDRHRLVRKPPVAPDWNEWGFFDYATLHPNLTAHHCDVAAFRPSAMFAAIYSACAIAHMPAATKGAVLPLPALAGAWR